MRRIGLPVIGFFRRDCDENDAAPQNRACPRNHWGGSFAGGADLSFAAYTYCGHVHEFQHADFHPIQFCFGPRILRWPLINTAFRGGGFVNALLVSVERTVPVLYAYVASQCVGRVSAVAQQGGIPGAHVLQLDVRNHHVCQRRPGSHLYGDIRNGADEYDLGARTAGMRQRLQRAFDSEFLPEPAQRVGRSRRDRRRGTLAHAFFHLCAALGDDFGNDHALQFVGAWTPGSTA